jgi:hypothetical protein
MNIKSKPVAECWWLLPVILVKQLILWEKEVDSLTGRCQEQGVSFSNYATNRHYLPQFNHFPTDYFKVEG